MQDYEALVLVAPALMGGFGRVGQGNGRTGVLSRSTHALNAVFGSGQLPSTVPVPRRYAASNAVLVTTVCSALRGTPRALYQANFEAPCYSSASAPGQAA